MLHQFKASFAVLAWMACFAFSQNAYAANPLSVTTTDPKAVVSGNRSIFMNGVDISSARNQDMRNVHIRISENGDIFITAPQYQVTEEETYTPLSSYTPGQGRPAHQPPMEMGADSRAVSPDGDGPTIAPTVTPNNLPAKTAKAAPASALPEKPAAVTPPK